MNKLFIGYFTSCCLFVPVTNWIAFLIPAFIWAGLTVYFLWEEEREIEGTCELRMVR